MKLFSITCTTCRARLKVRDASVIGAILACPKCGSMVQVVPPEGWKPPDPEPDKMPSPVAAGKSADPAGECDGALASGPGQHAAAGLDDQAEAASGGWHWAAWTGGPLVAVAALVGGWLAWRGNGAAPVPPTQVVEKAAKAVDAPARPSAPKKSDGVVRLDRRWIPSDSQLIVSLSLRRIDGNPSSKAFLEHFAPASRRWMRRLSGALGIAPQQIARLACAANQITSLANDSWLIDGVTVLELSKPLAVDEIKSSATTRETIVLAGSECPRFKVPPWPHTIVLATPTTIVTAPDSLLASLAAPKRAALNNPGLERLLLGANAKRDVVILGDLVAWRAHSSAPWLFSVWNLDQDAQDQWRTVRDLPLAIGLAADAGPHLRIRGTLVTSGVSSAETLRIALEKGLSATEKAIAEQADEIARTLLAGEVTTETAGQLKQLLSASLDLLRERRLDVQGRNVWVSSEWQGDLARMAKATQASGPALEAARLSKARLIDKRQHAQLLAGLHGYEKAEGALPFGAAGAQLLPPNTRLSWMATLLPYYGQLDWYSELNFARSWNDPANVHVARRPLALVTNPALGRSLSDAGFPVTHYVGMAGLGSDAGRLDARDPRAGVFGHNRRRSLESIGDGASNTIALAGVSKQLGPWAAGGEATVRSLTAKPYIDGPDGFGSGQPDGMLVGMADGSARFLSKDIDPRVLEYLVTANGEESLPPELFTIESSRPEAAASAKAVVERPQAAPAVPVVERPGIDPAAGQPIVDVAARLSEKIPSLSLAQTPLFELAALVSRLAAVPVSLDVDLLQALGQGPESLVSVEASNADLGSILSKALADLGLAYEVVNGQILITVPRDQRETMRTARLDVGDLARNGGEISQLAALIPRLVEPSSWKAAGGAGTLTVDGGELVVSQSLVVGRQVESLVERLRAARGNLAAGSDADRLLASRWSKARNRLDQKVTIAYPAGTPLTLIADHLSAATDSLILFDTLELAAAGHWPTPAAALSMHDERLDDALGQLLNPLGLGYRIMDQRTFLITSDEAASSQPACEVFPVADLLAKGHRPVELREDIMGEIDPTSWEESGGWAVLEFDPASTALLVRQSNDAMIEVEVLLDRLRGM